jgi:hypothetical protein
MGFRNKRSGHNPCPDKAATRHFAILQSGFYPALLMQHRIHNRAVLQFAILPTASQQQSSAAHVSATDEIFRKYQANAKNRH